MRAPLLAVTLLMLAPVASTAAPQVTPSAPDTDAPVHFAFPGNVTVRWDFGDGNTSASNPATHQFAMAGLYTVRYHLANGTAGSLAVLVRIPARLYATNATAHRSTHAAAHDSLLVAQPWILPLIVIVLGGGLLAGGRYLWQRRLRPDPIPPEPEPPLEPEGAPAIDLDSLIPLPPDGPASNEPEPGPSPPPPS